MEKLPGLKSDELMSFGVILVHLPEPTPQEHLGKFHQEKWLLWPTSGSRHYATSIGWWLMKKILGLQQSMICLLIQGHFLVAETSSINELWHCWWRNSYICLHLFVYEKLWSPPVTNMSRKKLHLHLNLLFHMQPREMIDMGFADFMASLRCWQKSLLLLLCCLTPELEPSSNLKLLLDYVHLNKILRSLDNKIIIISPISTTTKYPNNFGRIS